MRRLIWLLMATTLGCESGDGLGPAPTWHQDVEPILTARCLRCHRGGGVAPFRLDGYERAKAVANLISNAVEARRMPPWGAGEGDVPLLDNPSLTEEQITILKRWATHDSPEGEPDGPSTSVPAVGTRLSRVDITLEMAQPYTPRQEPDDYRCFVLEWPGDEITHVTGFNALPGNLQVVHHIAAYLMPPDTPLGDGLREKLLEWDEGEEGPGYTCFGGPSGPESLNVPIQQVAQWVPGMDGVDFPQGTGIVVKPGSMLVLQLHYNTGVSGPLPDQSRIQFKLDAQVERRAAFAPWLKIDWVMGGMTIPAGEKDVVHVAEDDPRPFWNMFVQDIGLDGDLLIHSALFHMHKLGRYGHLEKVDSEGKRTRILDMARYDFDWQQIYRLEEPVPFLAGEELSLLCSWDNEDRDQLPGQQPQDVGWGEGTGDEMCVANLYISER